MLNMMYSIALFRSMRQSLELSLKETPNLNPAARELLLNDLTIWSQGAGGQAVSAALDKTLKSHGQKLSGIFSAGNYTEFINAMKNEIKLSLEADLKKKPGVPIDVESSVQYLDNSKKTLKDLEAAANTSGQCGLF